MNTANLHSVLPGASITAPPTSFLLELAKFYDKTERALSFYFDTSTPSDISHRQELINLQNLIEAAKQHSSDGEIADLKFIGAMANEIVSKPRIFRGAFLSAFHGIRKQIELPLSCNIGILQQGRHFRLVPLLRALEACTPYGVVLVENGKARVFTVRGEEIQEWEDLIPAADLSLRAAVHQGVWPSHIKSNAEERTRKFLRDVAARVHQLALNEDIEYIVAGCREDLWASLEPELVRAGLGQVGSFHIQNFGASGYDVLQAAQPVYRALREETYRVFWNSLKENPSSSATGIRNVAEGLNEGRVRLLFISNGQFGELFECSRCGRGLSEHETRCPSCEHAPLTLDSVDEWMARRAILSGAKVIAEPLDHVSAERTAGALLRY